MIRLSALAWCAPLLILAPLPAIAAQDARISAPDARIAAQDAGDEQQERAADETVASTGPKMPELEFEDDGARDAFAQAWADFQRSNWSAATDGFKRALDGVRRQDRDTVTSYVDACKGGPKLDDIAILVGKGKWRRALTQLLKLEKKYGNSPLDLSIAAQREEIEDELFLTLADFEEKPKKKEEEPNDREGRVRELIEQFGRGPKYSAKPEFVREGKRSLIYQPKKRGAGGAFTANTRNTLTIARFDPEVLSEYRWLHVSIKAPEPGTGALSLSFDPAETPATVIVTSGDTQSEFHRFQPKPDWIDLRLDLWSKRVKAILAREPAYGFRIRMSPIVENPVYVDRVRLEKP